MTNDRTEAGRSSEVKKRWRPEVRIRRGKDPNPVGPETLMTYELIKVRRSAQQ